MATPGVKPKSAAIHEMRGTSKPYRAREEIVEHIDGNPERPKWLTGRARKIWEEKTAKYLSRGQSVKGCEDSLAQYCALEASLIDDYWRKKLTPPMAMVNGHRIFAGEFFDTPASQVKPSGNKAASNPFNRNGRGP